MATAIEYGLIAAGISIAAITAINGVGTSLSYRGWDDNFEKKKAAAACATRPAGDTSVVITTAIGQTKWEFKCSNWPRISYPTFVRIVD